MKIFNTPCCHVLFEETVWIKTCSVHGCSQNFAAIFISADQMSLALSKIALLPFFLPLQTSDQLKTVVCRSSWADRDTVQVDMPRLCPWIWIEKLIPVNDSLTLQFINKQWSLTQKTSLRFLVWALLPRLVIHSYSMFFHFLSLL